jgi:GTP 3',8-cyclase
MTKFTEATQHPEKAAAGQLIDSHGRVLRDLRVSVTDRCNFRCLYCLPETEAAANFYQNRFPGARDGTARITRQWQPHGQMMTFEEIERVVRIAVGLGIEKVRLTGGEPLLRQQIEKLVAMIARIPGVRDLAMTSNGFLFPQNGRALREAGLRRISFSLDSLTAKTSRRSPDATACRRCWRPLNWRRNWSCTLSRSMP